MTQTGTKEPHAPPEGAHDVFVARQPIFDEHKRLFAYELLFRGGLENVCPAGNPDRAAGQVLQAAWLTFGLPTLLGRHKAFVNFTRELLIKGYGETLPVESTVIELLETIDGDPRSSGPARGSRTRATSWRWTISSTGPHWTRSSRSPT